MKTLHSANLGEKVIIKNLLAKDDLRERLLSLGITKNLEVCVLRLGPLDNLKVYNIRGAMIALRREEAILIEVY